MTNPDFDVSGNPGDSARQYIEPDDPCYAYADMLYAWKTARNCFCLEVGEPTNIDGVPYDSNCTPQVDLEIDPDRPSWASDVFVAFRNYMESVTAVAADSNELA